MYSREHDRHETVIVQRDIHIYTMYSVYNSIDCVRQFALLSVSSDMMQICILTICNMVFVKHVFYKIKEIMNKY